MGVLNYLFSYISYKLYTAWKEYKDEKVKKEVQARKDIKAELGGEDINKLREEAYASIRARKEKENGSSKEKAE